MTSISAILPMTRAEADTLRRLIPHLDRLAAQLDGLHPQADEQGAAFRALQAMFHDVCRVLSPEQKQRLLQQWQGELQGPLWMQESKPPYTPDALEDDAANDVLAAAVQFLKYDLLHAQD